jgi:hypothetical protein
LRTQAQTIDKERAITLNRDAVKDCFEKLKSVMVEHGLTRKQEIIYNVYER